MIRYTQTHLAPCNQYCQKISDSLPYLTNWVTIECLSKFNPLLLNFFPHSLCHDVQRLVLRAHCVQFDEIGVVAPLQDGCFSANELDIAFSLRLQKNKKNDEIEEVLKHEKVTSDYRTLSSGIQSKIEREDKFSFDIFSMSRTSWVSQILQLSHFHLPSLHTQLLVNLITISLSLLTLTLSAFIDLIDTLRQLFHGRIPLLKPVKSDFRIGSLGTISAFLATISSKP